MKDTDRAEIQKAMAEEWQSDSLKQAVGDWLDKMNPEWRILEMKGLYSTKPEAEK